jgi:hypothetical protein
MNIHIKKEVSLPHPVFAECEAVSYSVDKLQLHKEQTNKAEPANAMFSSAAARWHFAEMQKRSIGVSRNKYE